MINISVIISTYNRERYILKCLDALKEQTLNNSYYEIIIVNNNSTDNTHLFCSNFIKENENINLTYVIEDNPGLSWARNRGIKEAKGNVLVFLDDDAFAPDHYLKEIFNYFNNIEKTASAFGGKILPKYESSKPKWMSSFLMPLMSIIDLGNSIKEFPSNKYPIGANMGFKAKLFKKYGGFNTSLGRKAGSMMGGEEKDLFNRLRDGNEKIVYLPNAWVYHLVPDSRLKKSFIKKQALGIVNSEKTRTQLINMMTYYRRIMLEIMKWFATVMLAFYFIFRFQLSKAVMLVKFRFWVSKGLLS
jgi:glycosyltransferase involved in cell wall biosynthesis